MTALILIAIGAIFSAISELSNQGKLDKFGVEWFNQDAWRNKYTWKPTGLWRFWPFIVFTDAFHFFKTLWICSVSVALYYQVDSCWAGFVAYSVMFSIVYSLIDYINGR